jgi:hypothetical protein
MSTWIIAVDNNDMESAGQKLARMRAEAKQRYHSEIIHGAIESIPALLQIFELNAYLGKCEAQVNPYDIIRNAGRYMIKNRDDYYTAISAWLNHENLRDVKITKIKKFRRNFICYEVTFSWKDAKIIKKNDGTTR